MVQPRRGLCLTTEPGLEGRVARKIDTQDLDGDRTAEPRVDRSPHFRHAAAAENRPQLIAPAQQRSLLGCHHDPPTTPARLFSPRTL